MCALETSRENRWKLSLKEFRSPRAVALCGVMGALAVILGMTTTISFGPYVKITLSNLPDRIVSATLGPAVGGVFAAAMEFIKFMLRPDGVYFPGFTVSAMLGNIIAGLFLYRRPVTLTRCAIVQVIIKIIINMGLNSLWLHILYNRAFWALMPARALTNAIRLPTDTVILFLTLKLIERNVLPVLKRRK